MTVASRTSRLSYVGDGQTVNFPVNFYFLDGAHLQVSVNGVVKTLNTDYVVTGAGTLSGGTVTFTAPPAVNDAVYIARQVPYTQLTDYLPNDPFPAESHERALDKLTMITQQLADIGAHALKAPANDPGEYTLSAALWAQRAGSLLGFDAYGAPTLYEVSTPAGATVEADYTPRDDGVTDETADLQAAIDAFGSAPGLLRIRRGVCLIDGVSLRSNVALVGEANWGTTLKRLGAATRAYLLEGTGLVRPTLRDLVLDGNRAAQSTPATTVSLVNCDGVTVERCKIMGGKVVNAAFGAGITLAGSTNDASRLRTRLMQCEVRDNDSTGIFVNRVKHLEVTDCHITSNGERGMVIIDRVSPAQIGVQQNILIARNHIDHNGMTGLGVDGGYSSILNGKLLYSASTFATVAMRIEGNFVEYNGEYGLGLEAQHVACVGNICRFNGLGSGLYAGILFFCQGSVCVGNVSVGNDGGGIDGGGSSSSIIAHNYCGANGTTSPLLGMGINLGCAVNDLCAHNIIENTGGTTGTIGIGASGLDGDVVSWMPWTTLDLVIRNNIIIQLNNNAFGIILTNLATNVIVEDNLVAGGDIWKAMIFETDSVSHRGNRCTSFGIAGANYPSLASASLLIVPDYAESCTITGSTGISEIRTYSQNNWYQKVRGVVMTNGGSGYTVAPTVQFSGGGGAGAAGTALLTNNGTVIGVAITNGGSGYTSAPTVQFSGGDGSGAAGTAAVGCINTNGQSLRLFLRDGLTLTRNANLLVTNPSLVAASGGVVRLMGMFGNWYQESFYSGN